MLPQLLIIEDNTLERTLYGRILSSEGYDVLEADCIKSAKAIIMRQVIHVIVLDVKLPDGSGLSFISEIKNISPDTEIILFTSTGSIPDGVNSIKLGAFDYMIKGDSPVRLIGMVNQASMQAMDKFMEKLHQKNLEEKGFASIIGDSPAIQHAKELAKRVAKTNANVLLLGETGVGKDLFAEAIHHSSLRHQQPFLAINCSAIGKEVLESELFGYKAGAFTGALKDKKGLFEMADHGTIFLDEIGEMGIELQAKLLRVLQNGTFIKLGDTKTTKVDCRLIAATNQNLELAIQKGSFREDLYYRISSFMIDIPPLRERDGDIQLLVKHLFNTLPNQLGIPKPSLKGNFVKALSTLHFKGNIRELINVMERAIILSNGVLDENLIIRPKVKKENASRSLHEIEKEHILNVIAECQGNKRKAARKLGIAIATLYRKLEVITPDRE
ncbi:sigma-54 dependent transcriptional regulator [uncultured Pedobacter sp.]|uniref:sigma-54-dependent transcriptional regulator n=1 Tax=uncultured Pedobacter sp. TaxID=246139 RepID=UPI0025DBE0B5|nr:sigma-54 dependent transcriptional regulator [uncultured Pedobacter sp.]